MFLLAYLTGSSLMHLHKKLLCMLMSLFLCTYGLHVRVDPDVNIKHAEGVSEAI